MRIIARSTLRAFWESHPESEQPLKAWFHEVSVARWANPHDVKESYRTASVLRSGRLVFNIGGNMFRLVVAVAYNAQTVFIKFIGTHSEYDRIDANTIDN